MFYKNEVLSVQTWDLENLIKDKIEDVKEVNIILLDNDCECELIFENNVNEKLIIKIIKEIFDLNDDDLEEISIDKTIVRLNMEYFKNIIEQEQNIKLLPSCINDYCNSVIYFFIEK